MPAPSTITDFLALIRRSGLIEESRLQAQVKRLSQAGLLPRDAARTAALFVREGILTQFQAEQLMLGRWRGFSIGKYKVLERLGAGGMGSVYLCEHRLMRRRVALKVLPTSKAADTSALERFHREARAVAALDHPNIVRAYDIDQDERVHFLVMEYIDGSSLQEIIKRHGALDPLRAAHYIRQSALGLQHAHDAAKLVHRDIKPSNILVDRGGVVKVLDLGLARFFHDEESTITRRYDENVLGTADYLAPEQALDSHTVDIRADIYSLGATFYYCLTGHPPFNEGTVAQKLLWHQSRQPKPVRQERPEVPEELEKILERMIAKDPDQRYQAPAEVAQALEPFTQQPIPPPSSKEMPRLSPAAAGAAPVVEEDSDSDGDGSSSKRSSRSSSKSGGAPTRAPMRTAPIAGPVTKTRRTGAAPNTSVALSPQTVSNAIAETSSDLPSGTDGTAEEAPHSWENLVIEAGVSARHSSSRRVRPSPRQGPPPWLSQLPRMWLLAGGIGLVAIAILVVAVAYWLNPTPSSVQKKFIPPPARQPQRLIVSRMGGPNTYSTLHEALQDARQGDRIIVREEKLEEPLLLEDRNLGLGLTIEAANPAKPVHWTCPANPPYHKFISLGYARGLHLKGFILDGAGRVQDLVIISGECPGLTLEDVELRGFAVSAMALWNCNGSQFARVALRRVRAIGGNGADSAVRFEASPNVQPPNNRWITFEDCRFEGPLRSAFRISAPALDVRLAGNRVWDVEDGILYERSTPRLPIRMTVERNTFANVHHAALQLAGLPLTTDGSRLELRNNLFDRTTVIAHTDEPERRQETGDVFVSAGNVCDPTTKPGNLPLGFSAMPVTLATDPADAEHFLRYPATSPLAHAGVEGGSVGSVDSYAAAR